MTKIVKSNDLNDAAKCLQNGGTVVFPTETVYGLGADALNEEAIEKIYKAKGRPSDNPLIIHIADINDIYKITKNISDDAKKIMEKFWPGPITMIFEKADIVPNKVTAGLNTVAVRFPSNETAQKLIKLSTRYVAAPSANISGSPSPTSLKYVCDDMVGRVDFIIDGGNCDVGIESTILDVSGDEFKILRPGAVTYEDILSVTDKIKDDYKDVKDVKTPKCPGMKYTHYSPNADVFVVMGEKEKCQRFILDKISNKTQKIGVLAYKDSKYDGADYVIYAGCDMKSYAACLYDSLREFDDNGIDVIYAQFENSNGIGVAVKNRIFKSAGYKIIEV
ncbi:MAG: threonylcarbamoyl-AMP synthase [Ruminococcaceae bacterium]|nr:threonylcarbamoyl-AMP synthase [Oscillospiraceae bacterium]